jgi:predicted RNA-binding protein YlqC (UPF0109 family)
MKEFLQFVAQQLVNNPNAVEVRETRGDTASILELRVAKEDSGRVIGKQRRTAKSLRSVLNAVASRTNRKPYSKSSKIKAGNRFWAHNCVKPEKTRASETCPPLCSMPSRRALGTAAGTNQSACGACRRQETPGSDGGAPGNKLEPSGSLRASTAGKIPPLSPSRNLKAQR